MKERAIFKVSDLTNNQLKLLLKERYELASLEFPAKKKLSDDMKILFDLEEGYWGDKYHSVKISIESEVLHRIIKDKW